jgi:hypothetical protein
MRRASRAVARTAFLVLGSVTFLCGCASDSTDEPSSESTQALANTGHGTGWTRSCKDRSGECHLGCDVSYPWSKDDARKLNSEYRTACQNSCDADYRLCKEPAARHAPGGRIPPP